MHAVDWVGVILDRAAPGDATASPGVPPVVVVGLALAAVAWGGSWRVLRLAVTLVHELGHAAVGVAGGRRFTGFVLRADMSGHAVTVGPTTGPALLATTWAGYPAPALVGAGVVWLGARGWAAPVLTLALLGLAAALPFVRSMLTGLVVLGVGALVAAAWWWRDDAVQQSVLLAVGTVLLLGSWRHLGAVVGARDPGSDPRVLARLSGVPALVWSGSFAVVCALATWLAVGEVVAVVRG